MGAQQSGSRAAQLTQPMNWYYVDGGRQAGPVDDAGLYALLAAGKITNETLVWREGLTDWQPFSAIRHGLTLMAPDPGVVPGWAAEHEVLVREYRIDIGGAEDCISEHRRCLLSARSRHRPPYSIPAAAKICFASGVAR